MASYRAAFDSKYEYSDGGFIPTVRATSLRESAATPSRRARAHAASRIVAIAASRRLSRHVDVGSPNTVRSMDRRSLFRQPLHTGGSSTADATKSWSGPG